MVSSSLEISWSLLFISSAGGMSILLMSTYVVINIMARTMDRDEGDYDELDHEDDKETLTGSAISLSGS